MAVKIEGESGLRGAYTDYIQDYLQRMSALLGRRDVNTATGQPDYTGPQFGGTGGGGYGVDTMRALQNLQTQREQRLAAGAMRPQFSFARRRAADGGVMSVVPEGYDDGGAVQGGDVQSTYSAPPGYNPTTFSSGYQAPGAYQAGTFSSGYQAPGAYQAGTFTTDKATANTFGQEQAQQYMSPFMSGVVDPQLREAKRQAELKRQAEAAKFAQAGAFGGSGRLLAEQSLGRNLATQLSDIYGAGQQKAFENAQSQFERDQARRAAAEQFNIDKALEAQKATEASRQFGYGKEFEAAKTAADLGLEAQRATEASRQFGYGKELEAAKTAADLGLEAQKATEASKQFGANQAMTAADKGAYYAQQARELQQRAEEAAARGDLDAQKAALDELKEAQRAAEATRTFEYQQARDTYLDPFRELMFANQALGGLPISAAATGISPETEAIISALGLSNLIK